MGALQWSPPDSVALAEMPIEEMERKMILSLPWPPSVNVYWRHVGSRVLISVEGRAYANKVYDCVLMQCAPRSSLDVSLRFDAPVSVDIIARPPNRARRDLDNLPKAILDALTKARVWEDDSLVHDLRVRWGGVRKGGEIQITINQMEAKE
ncbi:MAG TPA: RusA family crossover junction endodeoxyribonuclease [Fibrobacteria bacterium]|nr:RusA family crossover junction endodeoxyribonuclease [Fibrobacteria bacterium]